MTSTDESGIERILRANITQVSKPLLSAAEVFKRWDSLLFEDGGILLERNTLVALEIRAVLAKHKVWSRRGKSIRLYREGNLYSAYVRIGDVPPEPAPVEQAEDSWISMEVDGGQRNEQDESADQPELRSSKECWPLVSPQRWRGRNILKRIMLCSHFGARCVCVCVCESERTERAQHQRQTNKELAKPILQETLPAYCVPKVVRMETGEVLYMSTRPPPKISLRHEWKRELGSEHAQRSEVGQLTGSFQSNQPNQNPIRERTGRPVVRDDARTVQDERKTSRSQEIDVDSFHEEPVSSERSGRPVIETSVIQARSSEDSKDHNGEKAHERTRRLVFETHTQKMCQIVLKHVLFMKAKRSTLEMKHFVRER